MGFKLVKLSKDKVETPEPSVAFEPGIEEAGQGVMDEGVQVALAREVARLTRGLLNSQGWCLWKCGTLGGEVIVVVRDELVHGVPEGYVVYTEDEFEELCQDNVSEATLRQVHEAKSLAGARVMAGITNNEGGCHSKPKGEDNAK